MSAMRIVAFAAAFLLAACGMMTDGNRVDGSSPEAFAASMETVRADLGAERRAAFEAAVKLAQVQAFAKAGSRAEMDAAVRAELGGKTADEIILAAAGKREALTGAMLDKAFELKERAGAELGDLQAAKDAAEAELAQ
jgi:hypothetical protein